MLVCDLRYSGVPAWPPAWTSSLPAVIFLTGRVDGALRGVTVKSGGLEIEVEVAGEAFRGLMLWDGPPSPAHLRQILQRYVGYSLSEAGEATLPFIYDYERRGAA